jgi:CubicO group peptidase (beta-lactamase class C family)
VTLAIAYQGDTILCRAWGKTPFLIEVTVDTIFDLASLTKLYTTTALVVLLTREKLSVETPLVEILPEFGLISPRAIDGGQDPHTKERLPIADGLINRKIRPQDVTLWHLLTHTSGLPPWRDVYNQVDVPPPPQQPDTLNRQERWQAGLKWMVDLPFVDHVGANIRYSDIGLMLVGEVVSRLNDTDLETAVQQHVLTPIGAKHTLYNPVREHGIDREQIAPTELDPTWRNRRVWGEVHDENACGVGGVAGHAGLFANVGDVLKLGLAWHRCHSLKINDVLWTQAKTEQIKQGDERRGLGWMLRSQANSSAGELMSANAYGHTGFTGTSLWIDPELDLVIALLTNRVYVGRDVPGIHQLRRSVHDIIVEALND